HHRHAYVRRANRVHCGKAHEASSKAGSQPPTNKNPATQQNTSTGFRAAPHDYRTCLTVSAKDALTAVRDPRAQAVGTASQQCSVI
ncbi:hypothetical protein, partial [Mycobacterium leprae]|uniref:hypothetical protein n=1 Tax=Mycobacterium leprae TaxID=1769 RepID=UPI001E50A0B1